METSYVFSTTIESLIQIENVIDQITDEYKIKPETYGNIQLSIHEAMKNAIEHGSKEDERKKIHFSYAVAKKKITFVMLDEGEGFDYSKIPDPTKPENIENLTGRGIFLINNLADKVGFDKGGSQISISFRI